jgi:hypothetical protein
VCSVSTIGSAIEVRALLNRQDNIHVTLSRSRNHHQPGISATRQWLRCRKLNKTERQPKVFCCEIRTVISLPNTEIVERRQTLPYNSTSNNEEAINKTPPVGHQARSQKRSGKGCGMGRCRANKHGFEHERRK